MAEEATVSLRDEIGTNLDAALNDGGGDAGTTADAGAGSAQTEAGKPAESDAAAGTGSSDAGRTRGPDGRFLPKSDGADPVKPAAGEQQAAAPVEPQQAETQQQAAPQAQPQVDLPPTTWTAAAKAEWANLSPVVKAELKKRETDFQKGITQYSQAAQQWERVQRVTQPYEPMIRASGMTIEQTIQDLLDTNYKLVTGTPQQKGELIMRAARQFGADLTPFMQQGEQGQAQNPNIEAYVQQLVDARVQPIQRQFMTAQQQREQQEQQQIQSQIEAFRNATDEKGQPKHVYFDNVRRMMGALLENGDATTVEQAYEMACRAHPEVSQAMSAEQRKRDEAQRLEASRKAADDARRAQAANVTGQGGVGIADASKISLRDELSVALDGGAARV